MVERLPGYKLDTILQICGLRAEGREQDQQSRRRSYPSTRLSRHVISRILSSVLTNLVTFVGTLLMAGVIALMSIHQLRFPNCDGGSTSCYIISKSSGWIGVIVSIALCKPHFNL